MMPKRDDAYMEKQRAAIARAALEVLMDKGVYETSLRDICKAAGISIGSLYTHFKTKEEAITAACTLDHLQLEAEDPATTWSAYLDMFELWARGSQNETRRKRFRLSLQFVAELSQMDENPEGLDRIYHIYRGRIARSLECMAHAGEIALPLGIEMTTELHMQLAAGAEYQLMSDSSLLLEDVERAFRTGLELIAGRDPS